MRTVALYRINNLNMVRLFRSLLGAFAASSLVAASSGQVWEKLVVPGLTYRMEVDSAQPRMIHALRWSPGSDVKALPELAGGTVFEANPSFGRETISAMAKRTAAVAVINADFFPFTGDPIGLMVRDGELLSLPYLNRSSFAWGAGKAHAFGGSSASVQMRVADSLPLLIPQLNEDCKADSMCINTPAAGLAKSKATALHAIIRVSAGSWKVGAKAVGEVEQVVSGQDLPIPVGKCILTGTGTMTGEVSKLKPGMQVEFELGIGPFDWTKLDQAIGGGTNLVTRGLISTDAIAQGFDADFTEKRHPRTAVGRTVEGDLLFVAIDGRQEISTGATIEEMARVMQRLGCMDAINLDGGGSTTLNVLGLTLNRPSGGREREVANGIAFIGKSPVAEQAALVIDGPAKMAPKTQTYLKIVDSNKTPVANSEILWSASGSGWIDQGGFLRATAAGTIFVSAYVHGRAVVLGVTVAAP